MTLSTTQIRVLGVLHLDISTGYRYYALRKGFSFFSRRSNNSNNNFSERTIKQQCSRWNTQGPEGEGGRKGGGRKWNGKRQKDGKGIRNKGREVKRTWRGKKRGANKRGRQTRRVQRDSKGTGTLKCECDAAGAWSTDKLEIARDCVEATAGYSPAAKQSSQGKMERSGSVSQGAATKGCDARAEAPEKESGKPWGKSGIGSVATTDDQKSVEIETTKRTNRAQMK